MTNGRLAAASIAAARWTLHHGDTRSRAGALEYLDNILTGQLRKQIMPVIEEMPLAEKVRRGNVLLKTRPRDTEGGERFGLGGRTVPGGHVVPRLSDAAGHVAPHDAGAQEADRRPLGSRCPAGGRLS